MIPSIISEALKSCAQSVNEGVQYSQAVLAAVGELAAPILYDAYESTPWLKKTVETTVVVTKDVFVALGESETVQYTGAALSVAGEFAGGVYEESPLAPFAKSVLGGQVVYIAKGAVGDFAGATIGALAPEAIIAYSVGKHVAHRKIPESEGKSSLVRAAGISAAAAVSILTKSLSYFTGIVFDGSLLTVASSIAGGYEGRLLATGAASDSYYIKSVQSLTARKAVGSLRNVVVLPSDLSWPIWIINTIVSRSIGGTVEMAVGIAAGNGRELINLGTSIYKRAPTEGYLNPGRIVRGYANRESGNAFNFVQEITHEIKMPPVLLGTFQRAISRSIDQQSGTRSFMRGLNQYFRLIQNPAVAQKLSELRDETDPARIAALKTEYRDLVYAAFKNECSIFVRVLSYSTRFIPEAHISGMVDMACKMLESTEKSMTGFVLSKRETYKKLLEVHVFCILPLIAAQSARIQILGRISGRFNPELSKAEIDEFYSNLLHVVMAPYKGSRIGGALQGVCEMMLPAILDSTKVVPGIVDKIIECFEQQQENMIEVIQEAEFGVPRVASQSAFRKFISKVVGLLGTAWMNLITRFENAAASIKARKKKSKIPYVQPIRVRTKPVIRNGPRLINRD